MSVAAGGVAAGPPRCGPGRRATSSAAYRGGRPASSHPPARPLPEAAGAEFAAPASRALAGGSAFVRACPARPPPLPGSGREGGKSKPRARVGRQLPEELAGAGSETETKGKPEIPGGRHYLFVCETDNFFFLSLHNTDFRISHSFYYDYCHHLCMSLAFPFI